LSDLIGFVLTFSVIVASVGLVSTFGLDAMEDVQGNEQVNNAERAFMMLEGNLNEIQNGNAPKRTSEIELHNGEIAFMEDPSFRIIVPQTSDVTAPYADPVYDATFDTLRLEFRYEDSFIVYENGATFRSSPDRGTGIIQATPSFHCTEDQAMVSLATMTTKNDRKLGGGTVRVRAEHRRTDVLYPFNRSGTDTARDGAGVIIEVNSQFSSAWEKYFTQDDSAWEPVTGVDDQYVCGDLGDSDTPRTVYVQETLMNVTLLR
jgi:hypothetical protein